MNDVYSDNCRLKYLENDYIKNLYLPEDEAISAIADLIGDLRKDKIMTVNYIINQDDVNSLLNQFLRLLKASLPIIVGNTAYILGTLAEFEEGRSKIVHILSLEDSKQFNSLDLLVSLLNSDDSETLLNVSGTIGSLVESSEGRQFLLSQLKRFSNLIEKVTHLLISTDLWIASNAALIIARITIDEIGNSLILSSSLLDVIIVNLINSLTIDNAGRGMNAAFALGRIFDKGKTIVTYYSLIYKLRFIEKLVNITRSSETSFVKNSCFCLSSVMGSDKGYDLVIADSSFNGLLVNLENLLSLEEDETIWFSVLTLKIITKKPTGCKLLRKSKSIRHNVKKCLHNIKLSNEVKSECQEIINNLSPLEKPPKPMVELISPYEVFVTWKYPNIINEFELKSYLYYKEDDDEVLAYRGKKTEISVKGLEPNTNYEFYLKFTNQIEISVPSDTCHILTAEDYPSEPTNIRIITCTSNQIKIGWDEPLKLNGVLKHYLISLNSKSIEQTNDRTSIVSGLKPNTRYTFGICAVNSCGRGICGEIEASTLTAGAHAPDKPTVSMLGKSEASLSWNPPEAPMGKIFRYDVKMNQKKIVYSGINTYCKISNLKPDSEYTFSVIVVTSDGKYESPISRKRSGKDEYLSTHRSPLYESKVRSDSNDNTQSQTSLSSTNCLNNSSKFQKLPFATPIRRKSENVGILKSHNVKTPVNLTQILNKNSLSSENLKLSTVKLNENNVESSTKFHPVVLNGSNSKPQRTKSFGVNVSNTDNFTNSISTPSLSSVSLDIAAQPYKKSSDTLVTNFKFGDKSESGKILSEEPCNIVSRCQFRKISIKNNENFTKHSFKNSYSDPKNYLQRKCSTTTYR